MTKSKSKKRKLKNSNDSATSSTSTTSQGSDSTTTTPVSSILNETNSVLYGDSNNLNAEIPITSTPMASNSNTDIHQHIVETNNKLGVIMSKLSKLDLIEKKLDRLDTSVAKLDMKVRTVEQKNGRI